MEDGNKLDIFPDEEEKTNDNQEIKDSLYYEKQLKKVLHNEELDRRVLAGERWTHVGGKFYKILKFLFFLVSIWTMFFNLVLILGWTLNIDEYVDAKSNLTITSVLTFSLAICMFLMIFKKPKIVPTILISIPTAVTSVVVFWRWYSSDPGTLDVTKSYQNSIYIKFIFCNIPVVLIPLIVIILFIIIIKDAKYDNKVYERTVRAIFAENKSEDGILSNEAWAEILKSYTPEKQNRLELKKSKKNKVKS